MKKIFTALTSALLVSTAFAQTAAPAMSGDHSTQAAGQANLKADGAMSTDAAKSDVKPQTGKTGGVHTQKTRAKKVSKKKHAAVASVEKTKASGDSKEANAAPVKTDGAKADTTKTN
ncbi:hypothetical protein [Paraburkholderia sp. BCC1885]|uniref:hypothetical protein n=1 Tax=Paraburkholderia sp. BCC1885 TaxID=2562669 RepID=UPI00118383F7|nr:hypothetical protein [Paraburkholderia sp. BCC1885]